jgi:hypothetical protein
MDAQIERHGIPVGQDTRRRKNVREQLDDRNRRGQAELGIVFDILLRLTDEYGYTQQELVDLNDKYGLIGFIRRCYPEFHIEGVYANIATVKEYLAENGVTLRKRSRR